MKNTKLKMKIAAIALGCICLVGGVTFLFGHQQSASEIQTAGDSVTSTVTEDLTMEISSEDAGTQPTSADLNTIGITVGDSYEFTH